MKPLLILSLFVLTVARGWTQQVFVDPTTVTLTKPGSVTVIVTAKIIGHNVSFDAYYTATVGTIKATYYHAIYANEGTSVGSWIEASAVASGTLDAGTYPLTIETNQDGWNNPSPDPEQYPRQITVILWNENAEGGSGSITLNDLTLTYQSATEEDKQAFQTLIVSLVQQQLDTLQARIDAQQNQINSILEQLAALQASSDSQNADLQSQIDTLHDTVESQHNSITSLQQSFATMQSQYSQLSDHVASLTTPVHSTATTTNGSDQSDDTLTNVSVGLGAAAVIGSVVNFFTGDGHTNNPAATDEVLFIPERSTP